MLSLKLGKFFTEVRVSRYDSEKRYVLPKMKAYIETKHGITVIMPAVGRHRC